LRRFTSRPAVERQTPPGKVLLGTLQDPQLITPPTLQTRPARVYSYRSLY
jgi:hypothetical protein